MPGSGRLNRPDACECSTVRDRPGPARQKPSSTLLLEHSLQNLIPVAVVIAGGCEKCTSVTVRRALEQGSSIEDIETVLRIVARMLDIACIVEAFGPEAISRMEKPLAAARRTLTASATRTDP